MYKFKVSHLHADNGRFVNMAFQKVVTQEIQMISYCGVNDHFQNEKVVQQISDLQEQTGEISAFIT